MKKKASIQIEAGYSAFLLIGFIAGCFTGNWLPFGMLFLWFGWSEYCHWKKEKKN